MYTLIKRRHAPKKGPMILKCGKGCGADVTFIHRPEGGRAFPVDPNPILGAALPRGIWTLITPDGEILRHPAPDVEGYVPHWLTCPCSKRFVRSSTSNGHKEGQHHA